MSFPKRKAVFLVAILFIVSYHYIILANTKLSSHHFFLNSRRTCDCPKEITAKTDITSISQRHEENGQVTYNQSRLESLPEVLQLENLQKVTLNDNIHNTTIHHKENLPGDISNSETLPELLEHSNSNTIGLNENAYNPSFCIPIDELDKIPSTCNKTPKYKFGNGVIMGFSPLGNPGPSEQNHGFREVFMIAVQSKKSIQINKFGAHGTDRLSTVRIIPFGLRFDIERLCEYVNVVDLPKSEINTVIISVESRRG